MPAFHGETEFHVYVEYGNRMVGVLLGFVAIALALLMRLAVKRLGRSRTLRRLAYGVIGMVLLQGLIGGISVRLSLHPAVVGSHFLLSAVLLVLSTTLAVRWFEADGAAARSAAAWLRTLGWLVAALAVAVVVLGVIVTGSGPHSGDDEVGYRFAVDPYEMAKAHAATVWMFVAALVGAAGHGAAGSRRCRWCGGGC